MQKINKKVAKRKGFLDWIGKNIFKTGSINERFSVLLSLEKKFKKGMIEKIE